VLRSLDGHFFTQLSWREGEVGFEPVQNWSLLTRCFAEEQAVGAEAWLLVPRPRARLAVAQARRGLVAGPWAGRGAAGLVVAPGSCSPGGPAGCPVLDGSIQCVLVG